MTQDTRSAQPLSLPQAIALGLLQGPTELLPVSSSGHTSLLPWLARWPYARADPELRKSFEVALHTGSGLALAIALRGELADALRELDGRQGGMVALSLAPPTVAGYSLERVIERRLGGPRSIAAGLVAGAVAMALADGRGSRRKASRGRGEAGPRDGLALGLAQAAALIPGVSRSGATLAAARARGFDRAAATSLSWHAGLPVLLGASALKGYRLARDGIPKETAALLAAGGSSAFLSTFAAARLLGRNRREGPPLLPYALYRCVLAAFVLQRLRRDRATNAEQIKK
ncbi:MAG TPA: undecaprenyl-diphosphate phosphatase [Solirubrobacteraceae bacterium]|jgi:undecaprenyl-diphosphatase